MGKAEFNSYLKEQDAILASQPKINWEKEKEYWLKNIIKLYDQIEAYLQEFKKKGDVKFLYEPIEKHEEKLGAYSANKMIISVKGTNVTLDPIGTILIGASGRIDMTGPSGTVRFVLVPGEETGVGLRITVVDGANENREKKDSSDPQGVTQTLTWKIATPPPNIRYEELDEESFFEALMEVINA